MGRREEKNERTKSAIIENALELFKQRGFESVTVEEITSAAGIAKGTFYNYFQAKSEIIVEEFWKIDRYYSHYADRNLRRYAGADERLRAFTRAQMRYVQKVVGVEHLKILYVNQTLQSGQGKVIIDPNRQWYRIVESIIAEGQADGTLRTDRAARDLSYEFNRSMRSIFLDWCIADGAFDLVKVAMTFLEEWLLPALRYRAESPR